MATFEKLPASPVSDESDASKDSDFDADNHDHLQLSWPWLLPILVQAAMTIGIAGYNLCVRSYEEHPDERYGESVDIINALAGVVGSIAAHRAAHCEALRIVMADGRHDDRSAIVSTIIGSSRSSLWVRPWVIRTIKVLSVLSMLFPASWFYERGLVHEQKYLALNWLVDGWRTSPTLAVYMAVLGGSAVNAVLLTLQFPVLVLTWCASMDAVDEFIRHIEAPQPIYWNRLTFEYSELDRKFEELWSVRRGVALPWLVVCCRSILGFMWGIFAYLYNKDVHPARAVIAVTWNAAGGSFVLLVCLYALSQITTACTSNMATTRSIVSVARQCRAKDVASNDIAYLSFMAGIDHSAMGVELVGILVDVKLVSRVLLTLSVQLPVAYGIITATVSSIKHHQVDGRVAL